MEKSIHERVKKGMGESGRQGQGQKSGEVKGRNEKKEGVLSEHG